jgi:hypothetical protein
VNTVVEAKKPRISFSQLGSWNRCEQAWDYSYKQGWKIREQKQYFALGGTGHEMMAAYYLNLKEGITNRGELLEAHLLFVQQLLSEGTVRDLETISRAAWLVQHYIDDFAHLEDQGHTIVEVEHELVIPLTSPNGLDYELVGIYDLLTQRQGRLWLWDHKFTGRFWNPIQAIMDSQMPMYCAALRATGKEVFGIIINMVNTYNYKDPSKTTPAQLFRREKTYRTSQELDSILFHVGLSVERKWEAQTNENWVPIRALNKDCDRCSFQEPCLFEIKGIDSAPILRAKYEKKGDRIPNNPVQGREELDLVAAELQSDGEE